jgi:hypothetical protein
MRPSPLLLLAVSSLPLLGCGSGSSGTSPDSGSTGGGDDGSGGGRTDGASSSGGGGDDGSGGDSGGNAPCLTGTVNFELQAAAGSGTGYCLGASSSCNGGTWLSILPADGGAALSQEMGCVPDCLDCQPVACSKLCIATPALGDGGAHESWDGTYLEYTTCGASISCTNDRCAPAGNYIAHMCGYPEGDASFGEACQGSSIPACVDVPFVWPPANGSSPTLVGTIGARADAGTSD